MVSYDHRIIQRVSPGDFADMEDYHDEVISMYQTYFSSTLVTGKE